MEEGVKSSDGGALVIKSRETVRAQAADPYPSR